MTYIIGIDFGSDPVVGAAVNILSQAWPDATVTDYFIDGDYPAMAGQDVVYVVGHGDAVKGLAGVDLSGANQLDGRFRELLEGSSQTVLVACSTADESQVLLGEGFMPATFAENLSRQLEIEVVGANGPVVVDEEERTLTVAGVLGSWRGFGEAGTGVATDPIGPGGDPARGNGEGSDFGE